MADIKLYFPKVLPAAGGYVNDPNDKGGPTKYDVTLATWQSMGYDKNHDGHIDAEDIKLLTPEDAESICKKGYWDVWKADKIKNQSIAESLVEWVWGSGRWGIIIPQRLLGVTEDGIVGTKTITKLNSLDPAVFHEQLRIAKIQFINDLVKKSIDDYHRQRPVASQGDLLEHTQLKFQNGWINRINAFKYEPTQTA